MARQFPDRHVLYEAAVQGVEYDVDFLQRVYHFHRAGRRFTRLREDFSGTAALACAWVRRGKDHRAWAVDHSREELDWARAHRVPRLRAHARRLSLVQRDVRRSGVPPVDVVCALNFSYWVFERRQELVGYFRGVRDSLRRDGVFVCNAFGGTGAMQKLVEKTRVPASRGPNGEHVPGFTYVWEHASFNPIDHHITCAIHFRFRGGRMIRNAFFYDWRMWTLPELNDALREAGFRDVVFYVEGWDDKRGKPEEHYRRRTRFENQSGWLACLVALR